MRAAIPLIAMERQLMITKDGSHTVSLPGESVTYHSIYGAIRESVHVFLKHGLQYYAKNKKSKEISIFEMGFGTGLNAFLTATEAARKETLIHYFSIESAPLDKELAMQLNYPGLLGHHELFYALHDAKWNTTANISEWFILSKIYDNLLIHSEFCPVDIIYYDAFSPSAQPQLWTTEIFRKLFQILKPGGLLVTYCSKGSVRRAMQEAGFAVEKIPGPPGKREMLRACK